MNKMNKIPAFTMVDILTGMVITSLIMGMVFYLFTALNKQIRDYGEVRHEINSFLLLKGDLGRKFESSEYVIEAVPQGFMMSSSIDEVLFIQENEYLIRHSNLTRDTVCHQLVELEVEQYPKLDVDSPELVRSVTVKIRIQDEELSTYFVRGADQVERINQALINGI